MPRFIAILLALPALALLACADTSSASRDQLDDAALEPETADGGQAAPGAFAAQVELGKGLYEENCAGCHGRTGLGGEGPALVGLAEGALPLEPARGAARLGQFSTVADVAEFTKVAMPPGKQGSLQPAEHLAILAFILSANGVSLEQELTAELAETLLIPRPGQ